MTQQRQGPPMHEIKRWGSGISATAIDMCSNGDGTMYIACMVNNGADAWIELTKRSADLATELDNLRLDPAPEPPSGADKEDAPCVGVVRYPSGRTAVRLVGLSHFTAEETGRPFIMSAVDVTDMGAVFDPSNPKHFEAEPIQGGDPNPPQPDPTIQEQEAMIRRVLGIDNTNSLIGALRPQIRSNVEQLFQDGVHGGSYTVYQQEINTAFAGCVGALHQTGQIDKATHDALLASLPPVKMEKPSSSRKRAKPRS